MNPKNPLDLDKFYVSPYDRFLFEFDANHAKTSSQLKEVKKHRRIAKLRDHVRSDDQTIELWDEF
jgi:hypothetical protein